MPAHTSGLELKVCRRSWASAAASVNTQQLGQANQARLCETQVSSNNFPARGHVFFNRAGCRPAFAGPLAALWHGLQQRGEAASSACRHMHNGCQDLSSGRLQPIGEPRHSTSCALLRAAAHRGVPTTAARQGRARRAWCWRAPLAASTWCNFALPPACSTLGSAQAACVAMSAHICPCY